MRKIIYQQPHVIVRIINPEELLQGIGVNSDPGSGVDGPGADAKFQDFDDDENDGFNSSNIWED